MMQQKVKTTRAPGLRLDKNRRLTPMQIYCWATVVCLAVLLLALLASRGALLHRFFFYDVTDTGMDFFHSIEYMRGRMPYGQFDTLYPPLANLFFYVLYLLVPKTQSATWTESFISSLNMKGTERDLRLQQATMMLFIVFVIVVVLGIVSMTERLTRSCGGRKELLAFCAVFSYGVLYGLERGNILLLCWPLMAFFILYRNSENPLLRELACLALAIAAGFKLYPAFLGVLLLRDKNYLAAVRTVLYGVVCLCFPLFFFNEGLFGLTLWFRVLFDFSGSRGEPWIGNGFSNILAEAGHAVDKLLGTQLGYGSYALLGIVLAAVLLVCSFFMDKEWKRITAIILAMLMFQSQYDYVWCLFLIPLFRRDQWEPSFVPRNTICHAMLLLLIVWCFVQAVQGVRVRCAEKPVKPAHGHPAATVLLAVCVAVAGVGGQQLWQRTHNWGFDYGYNGRLDAEGIQQKDVQDSDGNPVEVTWSGRGAYIMIYNHAPFTQRMVVTFQTGYGMDLKRAYTMTFEAPNLEDADGTTGKQKRTDIKIDHEGQTVCYTVDVVPGQTQIDVSYDGPMAVYDASSRKNGTFSVANLAVTSEGAVEETE